MRAERLRILPLTRSDERNQIKNQTIASIRVPKSCRAILPPNFHQLSQSIRRIAEYNQHSTALSGFPHLTHVDARYCQRSAIEALIALSLLLTFIGHHLLRPPLLYDPAHPELKPFRMSK